MLTLDKIYHASYVLKDVIRQTNIVQARVFVMIVMFISNPKIFRLQVRSR